MYTSEKAPDPPGYKVLSESCLNTIYSLVCGFWKALSIRLTVKWKSTEEGSAGTAQRGSCFAWPETKDLPCTSAAYSVEGCIFFFGTATSMSSSWCSCTGTERVRPCWARWHPLSRSSRNESMSSSASLVKPIIPEKSDLSEEPDPLSQAHNLLSKCEAHQTRPRMILETL